MVNTLTRYNVRAQRERARMTQEALAHAAGLSKAGIQNIERGRVTPKDETLCAIAEALGCEFQPEPTPVDAVTESSWPRPSDSLAAEVAAPGTAPVPAAAPCPPAGAPGAGATDDDAEAVAS